MPGRQKILNPFTLRSPSRYDDIERLDDGKRLDDEPAASLSRLDDAPSAAQQPRQDLKPQ